MFLYGSQLSKKLFKDFRNPNDTDWVTNDINEYQNTLKSKMIEIEYIPCTPNREMTADELYTLKFSHAIYDIHWKKTMSDIRFFQLKGCKIVPDFLNNLRKFWELKYSKKRCNFDNSDTFFQDNVKREIEHDELHKLINPIPAYTLIVDGVMPNKNKFDDLLISLKDKICLEEAYVIAIRICCPEFI